MRTTLLKRLSIFRTFIDYTTSGQKLYVIGIVFFLWGLITNPFFEKAHLVTMFGVIVFSLGFVMEGIAVVEKIWRSRIGKLFISIFIAAGSTITVAFSATIIANITGTDPSKFPYTVALVGIFFLPVYIWLGLIIMSMSYMTIGILFVPFSLMLRQIKNIPSTRYIFRIKEKPSKERYFWILLITRFIALGVLLSTLKIVGNFGKTYSDFVTKNATIFLFSYEMYSKSHCSKNDTNEKFAYINAKDVLIGTIDSKKEYKFSSRQCHIEK